MAYCYECGEQVAENVIFCPYCGISLPPMAIVGEEDDSLDKTIAMPQAATAAPKSFGLESQTASGSASSSVPEKPFIKERLDGSAGSKNKTEEFTNDVTSENLDWKTESIEIPPEAIENRFVRNENPEAEISVFQKENQPSLGEISPISNQPRSFENTEDNAEIHKPKILETLTPVVEMPERIVACEGEKNVESEMPDFDSAEMKAADETNLEPVFVSTEGEKLENETGEIDSPAELQTESSLMSYEESEVKEVLSAEEPEKSVDEIIESSSGENEFSGDIQPVRSGSNDFDAEQDNSSEHVNAGGKSVVTEKTEFTANMNENSASDEATTAEQPIAMPEIELPVEDSCPPSRFDSVSIMEKKPETSERTPVKESLEITAQTEPKAESPITEIKPKERKEEHSHTTPNIGGDTDGRNKTKLKPLNEGTVLNGRYEIIRKIGGGGMGAVYLASDKNLGGVLRAVKEMVQSYIEDAQQEKAVNDFKRESLLLTSLDHQSIPTIYDYFFDEKEARFYLVMKYISGGDLAGRLRSAPESRIEEASVTQWAIQVADVLDYLHNRQPPIVYRDLKPANIMIDSNSGRVMLIDFGIARWVNKEEKGVTAVGTMGYAPPELFSGNVESRSDIYSLGSTMFHLLTGADPQSNPLLIFDFQKHPRPRQINPQLSDQMERILMRAVEYNADKRFASAADFRNALEEHQDNLKANKVTFGVKEAPSPVALSDQPVFCGFCGQKIVATDMFCAFCGAKQPLAQQGVHSYTEGYTAAPLTAQLLIIGTNELEQPAFRLEKDENLVGRRDPMSNIFPEVDLSKFDPQTKISRRHARIWREGGEFMVEDLGSSNGTYILPVVSDAKRLQPRQPQLLTNGDKIRLGDTTLHFVLG